MYLYKKHYVGNKYREPSEQVNVVPAEGDNRVSGLRQERVSEISEEVMYWRKANHIHGWFVREVQGGEDDCKEYVVSIEQLGRLLETCEQVLKSSGLIYLPNESGAVMKNDEVARELLPVCEGFFFGGTEYDEYYYNNLKETVEGLRALLAEDNRVCSFYYQSSW